MIERLARGAIKAALAAALLAAAGCTSDPPLGSGAPGRGTAAFTDRAMAALSRGDYAAAEALAGQAVNDDPGDPRAVLAMAVVYERTGRTARAVEYYRALQAMQPQGSAMVGTPEPRPLVEIAAAAIERLEGRAVPAKAQAPRPGDAAQRFEVLRQLLERGLVTPEEYQARRNDNLGALLRYSEAPPAAGLDWPPPRLDQFVQRLESLTRALERGAITPREHALERQAILQALLPLDPRVRAPAPPPPDVAATLARLQGLRAAGLVSPEEAARERAAIERFLPPPPPRDEAPQTLIPAEPRPATAAAPAEPAGGFAVHLASYKSESAARDGWAQLRKRHGALLGALAPSVTRVELPGKGVFWRLKAGPLSDRAAAEALCAKLEARKQYCEPAFAGG